MDPALRDRLATAGGGERVEAVLVLRPGQGSGDTTAEPEQVEQLVAGVLGRIAAETGSEDYEFNVFGFLESFAVAAEPSFLERLLSQPEIESATTNRPASE